MNFQIQSRNVELTDPVRDYIERKVGRLDRYLPSLNEARVELREQSTRSASQRYVVQLTLYDSHGTILRGEERAADILPAVDTVTDKLHRQITRFKGKRKDRYQRNGGPAEESWGEDAPLAEETLEAMEEESAEIIRTKRFALSPMNSAEAIEQMQLLGHTFFVFLDGDTGNVNVVYRRDDGSYGLIIPEAG